MWVLFEKEALGLAIKIQAVHDDSRAGNPAVCARGVDILDLLIVSLASMSLFVKTCFNNFFCFANTLLGRTDYQSYLHIYESFKTWLLTNKNFLVNFS